MTSSRPAGALRQPVGVVRVADKNSSIRSLFLEVTFEAEGGAAGDQHALIDRTVGRVAGDATLADRFVFENEWTALRGVTLETGVVLA